MAGLLMTSLGIEVQPDKVAALGNVSRRHLEGFFAARFSRLHLGVTVFKIYAGNEVVKLVALPSDWCYDKTAPGHLKINGVPFSDRNLCCDRARNAQSKAVSPLLQDSFHVDTLTIQSDSARGKLCPRPPLEALVRCIESEAGRARRYSVYSVRNASIGFTRLARRAGR